MGGAAAPCGGADWPGGRRARGGGESRAPPRYTRGRAPRAAEAGRRAAGADRCAHLITSYQLTAAQECTARHCTALRGGSRCVPVRPVASRRSPPALHGAGAPGDAPRRVRGSGPGGTARSDSALLAKTGTPGFSHTEAVWRRGAHRVGGRRVGTGHPSGRQRPGSLTQPTAGDGAGCPLAAEGLGTSERGCRSAGSAGGSAPPLSRCQRRAPGPDPAAPGRAARDGHSPGPCPAANERVAGVS